MNVVKLEPPVTLERALETLDKLKEDLSSGRVIAYACVAVSTSDQVLAYADSVRPGTRLRLQGAISQLNHAACNGEL